MKIADTKEKGKVLSIALAYAMVVGGFFGLLVIAPPSSAAVYFFEDFEGGVADWGLMGYWHSVDDLADPCAVGAYSGSRSIGYHIDPFCTYDDGVRNFGNASLAVDIDLSLSTNPRLTFKSWLEDEVGPAWEFIEVYIWAVGGSGWSYLGSVNDPEHPRAHWSHVEMDLRDYAGESIRIRFAFDTDDNFDNAWRGWFIDDVLVDDDVPVPRFDFFAEDFESGSVGWTGTGLWHEVDDAIDPCVGGAADYQGAHSPTTSWGFHDDAFCDYDTGGTPTGRLVSPSIDLDVGMSARLTFWSWFEVESQTTEDLLYVQISTDGGSSWTNITELRGLGYPQITWRFVDLDITPWLGGNVRIGFYFDAVDPAENWFEGWYVDDVKIVGERRTLYSEWQSAPPTPDGIYSAGEHIMSPINSENLGLILGNDFDAWMIVENDADYLYITYDAMGDVTSDASDTSSVAFDTDRNYAPTDQADDQFYVDGGGTLGHYIWDSGMMVWVLEDGCDPGFGPNHTGLACAAGFGPSPNSAADHRIYEFRIPLLLLDVPLPVTDWYTLGAIGASEVSPAVLDGSVLPNDYDTWPVWYAGPPPLDLYGDIVLRGQPPNNPPLLDWTGEAGYTTDGLDPDSGDELTTFTYRILYQDADNDAPAASFPRLRVRDGGVNIPGSPFSMVFDSWVGAVGDYVAGAIYTYGTTLVCGGTYDYGFGAQDMPGDLTTTVWMPGPTVPCNNAPFLNWTDEPYYGKDGIHPHLGDETTMFEWRIAYSDLDGDPPGPSYPVVMIFDGGFDIPGSPFVMSFDSWVGAVDDYVAGARYTHSMTLSCGGDYDYRFATEDNNGDSFMTLESTGPDVMCPNTNPSLDWTGEPNYISDGLDPETGDEVTVYTYRVAFTDIDDDLPGVDDPRVSIRESGFDVAGSPFPMQEVDPIVSYLWDDFESGSVGWTATGLWHEVHDTTDPCAIGSWSSDHSWGYHADSSPPAMPYEICTYNEDGGGGVPVASAGELISPSVDLTVASSPWLSFRSWFIVESGFEIVNVDISDDGGGSWTTLENLNNIAHPMGSWEKVTLDISAYAGSTVSIRFELNTGDELFNSFQGWFLDDIWIYEGDVITSDGKLYTFDTTISPCGGTYTYQFTAMDENGGTATPTTELNGPTVACSPVLDWTGQPGYVSDGVGPDSGDTATTFTYRVLYMEWENQPPIAGHPIVHILDGGVGIGGSPFVMTFSSWVGAVGDYVAGAIYEYGTTLPSGTDYSYWFEALDDTGSAAAPTPELPGPSVALVGNNPPVAGGLSVDGFAPGTTEIMHIVNANPVFTWSYFDPEAAAQTDYQARVGTQSGFSDVWDPGAAGIPGTTVAYGGPPLTVGTDYYFAVRVMDDAQWSAWNETLFHMNAPPPAPTTPVDPPDSGSIDAGSGTTASWSILGSDPEGDAVTFFWEVSTDVAFSAIVASGSTSGTISDGFDTSPVTTYFWRVNATDGYNWSPYGNDPPGYWGFDTTAAVNEPPVASFPAVDGFLSGTAGVGHIVSGTPALNWSYSDPEAATQAEYEVRVGTQSGFSDMWAPGPMAGVVTSMAYAGSALSDGTDYYFGVRVSDGAKWSNWTDVLFHTNTPPPIPMLISPADSASDVASGGVDLDWEPSVDAEGDGITYYWFLSTESDFSTLEDSGSTGNTVDTANAQPITTYYWKVEAFDGYELSGNSTTFTFTTLPAVGTITGTVVNDSDSAPIEGATVELLDSNDDVVETDTANADGEFSFTNIDFGTYSVRVRKSGYESHLEEDVTISISDPDESLSIRLVKVEAPPFDWILLLIPLIVIAVVVLVIILLMRRKKPEEIPEAPTGQEPYLPQPPADE